MATGALFARAAFSSEIELADRVVVRKAEHKLYLYNGAHLLGVYKVELGLESGGAEGTGARLSAHPKGITSWRGAIPAATTSWRFKCPIPTKR